MTLTERNVGDVTVLELAGRLIYDEGDAVLRGRVNELVEAGRIKIVINLSNITYIDSCGVGAIISKYVSVRRKGGDLRLLDLSPRSHRVMKISGLLNVFQTFDNESAALKSFGVTQES